MKLKPKARAPTGTVPLAIDSGAHSLLTQFFAKKNADGEIVKGTTNADYSHVKSPEFRKYFEDYMAWLHLNQKHCRFYVTLDIIFNPELTWELYQEMKRNGLQPIPVYHFGEDPKWLKKYMEDTDYIGMGGIGHITKQQYLPFGDRSWKIICDARGAPRVKVHGFAMSSYDLMSRWPWYSVDSTTAFTFSRYGAITLPHVARDGKGFNYATKAMIMFVTGRTGNRDRHLAAKWPGGAVEKAALEVLSHTGLGLEDVADGGTSGHAARDVVNLYFMNKSMEVISRNHSARFGQEHRMYYYASGSPSGTMPGFLAGMEHLGALGETDYLCYLGTFFKGMRRPLNYLLETWHGVKQP